MFSKLLIGLSVVFLTACSNSGAISGPRATDLADVASTAGFLATGGVELNPLLSWSGDAAPVVTLGSKVIARTVIDRVPDEEQRESLHQFMDSINIGATCNNIGVILGGSFNPVIFLACGGAWWILSETQLND